MICLSRILESHSDLSHLFQVTYTNKKPAYYLNRQFKIACSELNGRFVSNEYAQTVSTIDI